MMQDTLQFFHTLLFKLRNNNDTKEASDTGLPRCRAWYMPTKCTSGSLQS
jgi:hypothetical protein